MLTQVLPAQFQQWLASHAANGIKPVVLDVREPWEVTLASIQPGEGFGTRCIPMHDIPGRLQELNPDHPVACLCHHGARSMSVAAFWSTTALRTSATSPAALMPGRSAQTPASPLLRPSDIPASCLLSSPL